MPDVIFGAAAGAPGVPTNGPVGFYGTPPIAQPSSTGEVSGFTANVGSAVLSGSSFTGNVGVSPYTIGDIVKHLKNLGLIAL